jgi:hypothetical protein
LSKESSEAVNPHKVYAKDKISNGIPEEAGIPVETGCGADYPIRTDVKIGMTTSSVPKFSKVLPGARGAADSGAGFPTSLRKGSRRLFS